MDVLLQSKLDYNKIVQAMFERDKFHLLQIKVQPRWSLPGRRI